MEFEWDHGDLAAHLRTAACGGHTETIAAGLALGETFDYSIVVDGKTVSVTTSRGAIKPYKYGWMNNSVPIYFKAGNYVQQNAGTPEEGATVKIIALSVSHA